MAPYWCSLFKIEMASAAPSVGSVPEQSSSNRQRLLSIAFFQEFFTNWSVRREGTETLLNTLPSPISANTSSKMASFDLSAAGM